MAGSAEYQLNVGTPAAATSRSCSPDPVSPEMHRHRRQGQSDGARTPTRPAGCLYRGAAASGHRSVSERKAPEADAMQPTSAAVQTSLTSRVKPNAAQWPGEPPSSRGPDLRDAPGRASLADDPASRRGAAEVAERPSLGGAQGGRRGRAWPRQKREAAPEEVKAACSCLALGHRPADSGAHELAARRERVRRRRPAPAVARAGATRPGRERGGRIPRS